jgi:hypothetical protein
MEGSPYWAMKADQAVDILLAELSPGVGENVSVTCRRLMAIAWLQGVLRGTEKTLKDLEVSSEEIQDRLSRMLNTEGA